MISRNLEGILIALALLFIVSLIAVPVTISAAGGAVPGYSVGQRSGQILKFSQKGLVWKSWEGQLLLHEFAGRQNGQDTSNVWEFSTRDPEIARQIEVAQSHGGRVTIGYHQYLIAPIEQSTDYTADRVTTE